MVSNADEEKPIIVVSKGIDLKNGSWKVSISSTSIKHKIYCTDTVYKSGWLRELIWIMRLRPTLGEDDEVMKNITRSWAILTFSAY
ncbi:hypothetical protein C5167_033171 [Papaver somniferum]|uniref:Uncharacterized protein n=1 Tax=Papaver somniferum TaxID=3469 RepID=A0A4Y7KB01_PAPSO|nr:hypothetical protein C5167_033171 [Papaver somniferum]